MTAEEFMHSFRVTALNKVADQYKGIYRKAFSAGFDHAVEGKGYGFGEHSGATDRKHIPKKAKEKPYLDAWMHGNYVGAECW